MRSSNLIFMERDLAFALAQIDDESRALEVCADALSTVSRLYGVAVRSGATTVSRGRLRAVAAREAERLEQNNVFFSDTGKLVGAATRGISGERPSLLNSAETGNVQVIIRDFPTLNEDLGRVWRFLVGDQVDQYCAIFLLLPEGESLLEDAVCSMERCAVLLDGTLRRISALRKLARAAEDKGLLVSELRHRTRNTFQLLQSTISFLLNRVGREDGHNLDELDQRIGAVAALYELLNSVDNGDLVQLDSYFSRLTDLLRRMSADGRSYLCCHQTSMDGKCLSLDRAASIGLIVYELVINSIKHLKAAYMTLSVSATSDRLELDYHDQAVEACGFMCESIPLYQAEGLDPTKNSGFGLKLLDALLCRAGGKRMDDRTNPRHFSAIFPAALQKERTFSA